MISFSNLDIIILIGFLFVVVAIGFIPAFFKINTAEDFLLSGRKVGLFLFVLTNVATWYGGILGVGEFTYRYGLVSWFTQGFPYYIFAFMFALFLAPKIRESNLFTIPDKLSEQYGTLVGKFSAILVFILVSPASYFLMIGSLISLIFQMNLFLSILIGAVVSVIYLYFGGYKSDLLTDAFEFFVMFIGFIILLVVCLQHFGSVDYLQSTLPSSHISVTGNASITFIIVWFLIALWTFTDPGFHQRCYAAKNGRVAKYGIIISIFFWALFDFLTTSTGLFARASLPNLDNPILAFPLLAENILMPGLKGIFFAGLLATILSTLNSFLFLSATTIARDFIFHFPKFSDENKLKTYTRIGLIISSIISLILAYLFESIVLIWYTLGSICIPGLIFLIIGAYYKKFSVSKNVAVVEIISGVLVSAGFYTIKQLLKFENILSEIEPMIAGLLTVAIIHIYGVLKKRKSVRTSN